MVRESTIVGPTRHQAPCWGLVSSSQQPCGRVLLSSFRDQQIKARRFN